MSQTILFVCGVGISFIVFTGAILYGMYSFEAWHEADKAASGKIYEK